MESQSRRPASFLEGRDLSVYRDLFGAPNYSKSIAYDVDFNLWTDKDGGYLRDKARLAVHDAFAKTMTQKGAGIDQTLPALLKANLMASFINRFIKTLYVFKILNGTFQIDLNFSPKSDSPHNFSREFSSNQMLNLEQKGQLASYLESDDKSLAEKVLDVQFPNSAENYQYQGGQVTLWLKILDLSWNPLNPIPNPKKNAVKGFVRYRRYFEINQLNQASLDLPGQDFKITKLKFKKKKKYQKGMITVDVYKEFNLSSLIPKIKRIEVFPGILKGHTVKQTGLKRFLSKREKNRKTGHLLVNGELVHSKRKIQFESTIEKIVLNIDNGKITAKSRIRSSIGQQNLTQSSKGQVKHKIRSFLANRYSPLFFKHLGFGRFHSKFLEGSDQ